MSRILRIFRRYKGKLSRHSRYSFSECAEDLILENILNMCSIFNYTYIDIGSNHPIKSNDFYRMYLNGNFGISIDPLSHLRYLYKARRNDVFLNAACVIEGSTDYVLIENLEDRLTRVIRKNETDKKIIKTITPSEFLAMMQVKLPLVIKIDIEGGDIELASAFLETFPNITLLIFETFEGLVGSNPNLIEFENRIRETFFKCALTPLNSFYVRKENWNFMA